MKKVRLFFLMMAMMMAATSFAQTKLTDNEQKAQKALIEYLNSNHITPSLYKQDNSVNFKYNDVSYWVTFSENSPVLYTIHRKGINFDKEKDFKTFYALVAANKVNNTTKVKCVYTDKRVDFTMETFAANPTDFHHVFRKMLNEFKNVEKIFREEYDRTKKNVEANNAPVVKPQSFNGSPLRVSNVSICGVDAGNSIISGYDQPIRSHGSKFIKEKITIRTSEAGIFKVGVKIYSPDGKVMLPQKNADFTTTTNLSLSKKNKDVEVELDKFGEDKANAWKAGEYKIQFYDTEKDALLYETTFNVL